MNTDYARYNAPLCIGKMAPSRDSARISIHF